MSSRKVRWHAQRSEVQQRRLFITLKNTYDDMVTIEAYKLIFLQKVIFSLCIDIHAFFEKCQHKMMKKFL
jgi:hypothetical protein